MDYEFPNLPLGMGATIGQLIRRSMYCQRQKWDIIGFRINDLHEFSTIPNSTDMVIDMLPKFKDMHWRLNAELESILSKNLEDETNMKFNLERFANSVSIFRKVKESAEDKDTTIMSISLFVDNVAFSSDDLKEWMDIDSKVVFCQMLTPTRLRITLYLMRVQGSISSEESYASISSVGITASGNSVSEQIIYLPGSNRGDFTVTCTYEEKLGKDVLKVTINPDTPETRKAVESTVTEVLIQVLNMVRTIGAGQDS